MNTLLQEMEHPLTQRERIEEIMLDGGWHTIPEIKAKVGAVMETTVSARIRDLRKRGMAVDRREISRGLWAYRVCKGGR